MIYVPVVDSKQVPLMPCSAKRARKMMESGKATGFWKKGVFCIRLNVEPSARNYQDVVVGVDPGSKKEGFTVKSEAHTLLNIEAEAVTHVKDRIETRRNLRRSRRNRKTPCRKNKKNRKRGGIPPSTKARWQWKLRVIRWLSKIYPISIIVVEDVSAKTKKNQRKWNSNFSPLEVGKKWFYEQCVQIADLITLKGYQTAEFRERLNLKKNRSSEFFAHCVDSWVLAWYAIGGTLDNTNVLHLFPYKFFRRQLHKQNFEKGGTRPLYGGTRSLGFKRGSLVKHKKYKLCFVGGNSKERISLHELSTGNRLCQNAKPEQIKFLSYAGWRFN